MIFNKLKICQISIGVSMVNPTRITVAFDKTTADLLEKISTETQVSQSEIIRRALKSTAKTKTSKTQPSRKKSTLI